MVKRIERKKRLGRKFYTNGPEDLAACFFNDRGFSFTRRGYPDITVLNEDGSIFGFVEVKPNTGRPLKPDQERFKDLCDRKGIPFVRWSPDEGTSKLEDFLKIEL